LQIVQGEYFLHLAEQNRIRKRPIKSLRGTILDRNGHVLADNRPAYTLKAIPEDLPSLKTLESGLRRLDATSAQPTLAALRAQRAVQAVVVQWDMPRDRVAYLAEHQMDFPGFFLDVEPVRSYPHGPLAAHLVGYLGQIRASQQHQRAYRDYPVDAMVGQSGLEKTYEAVLRGTDGLHQVEVDTFGRETRQLIVQLPAVGAHLVLTLDLGLQQVAERLLAEHTGSVVALDPRNGQILAMASRPTFDPNQFATRLSTADWHHLSNDPKHPLHNRALQGQYAPGSLFKILVALAALEEGIVTPATTVCCTGEYIYGQRTFRDWQHNGHGCVDLYAALVQSCDVYFYHVGQELGVDRLARKASAFGLGRVTGFAPEVEQPGLMPSTAWKRRVQGRPWFGGETLSVAIGQGYTLTTPLQMANVIATVANGGTLYQPYVVLRQETSDGALLRQYIPTILNRLTLQPSHLDLVKQSLWGVVHDPQGTGRQARHDHIAIAGKTATVQVVGLPPERGRAGAQTHWPEHRRDHAWFAAFAPVEAPRIVVVVLIEHAGKGGSHFAAMAKTVIEAYLRQDKQPTDAPTTAMLQP
jgi:penicillin-binding protein 2